MALKNYLNSIIDYAIKSNKFNILILFIYLHLLLNNEYQLN